MPCTTILVGKKASYDGSTMIARNDECVAVYSHGSFAVNGVETYCHVSVVRIGYGQCAFAEVGNAVSVAVFTVKNAASYYSFSHGVLNLFNGKVFLVVDGVKQMVHCLIGGRKNGVVSASREQVGKS